MNIVIPMAGMGKRLRPHTLVTPKPLIPVGGKPIVQRLVEDLAAMCAEPIREIAFVIGDFGDVVEKELIQIAEKNGAQGKIYYQHEALGTAHAIYCAEQALTGPVIVAFADTLFRADFRIDSSREGVIWVKQIPNPEAFGVVKLNESGAITDFVEKPKSFVSDLAIIGIYFFRDGDRLKSELKYLLDNDISKGGEYQLTDALENMKNKGLAFEPGRVDHWMDCGNKDATVETNSRLLEFDKDKLRVPASATIENSTLIQPVMVGENVRIVNSVVGPHVSLGAGSSVSDSRICNSIVREGARLENTVVENSMIGTHANVIGKAADLSLGDYSTVRI